MKRAARRHKSSFEIYASGFLLSERRTTGDGYYESCIIEIEGNQIELTV